ncbi:AAA family ATPase [Candidatus Saccharibacteria bacterium]|nr:AAA family ATPase [Candidatus Saccharibacteria bacterium]
MATACSSTPAPALRRGTSPRCETRRSVHGTPGIPPASRITEKHSVYRLIGSPPGYLGYDDVPVFEAVINNPYTIFIFDELDKAHSEVLKTFMSILDEGRCAARKEQKDHSREYDFRHCIFIFTSNFRLGSPAKNKVGFSPSDEIERISHVDEAVNISWRKETPEDSFGTVTQRIFRETEAARKAFVEAGVLREIASRFNCFVEFQELDDKAKIQILAKQVIATGCEYGIKLTYIASAVLQGLINAAMSGDALTVRSFKSVIEGYLAVAFAEAGARYEGQAVRLEGTLEMPRVVSAQGFPCGL